MKKISNEIKVGATALFTILVFIWLYNFLKGKDLLRSGTYYYSVYDEIGGLAESSPVEINGYKVGVVQSIEFVDELSGKLLVVFSVNKNSKIPKNTVAEITPISLLGGMKVQFIFGNGPGAYSDGDTIPGRLAQSLADKIESEISPVKDKLTNLIVTIDSVMVSVKDIMNPEFKKNFQGTLENLNGTTRSLNRVLSSKERELASTLENINRFTQMLSNNSERMATSFRNIETITDSIAAADIISSVKNLKVSLEETSLMIGNMNKGKGTAGKFLTNDTLYTNLTNSLESLNLLLKDLKANPKRYVHFSIFGKKSTPSL